MSGTVQLTRGEWLSFLAYVRDGAVRQRSDPDGDGDAGPWLYLYWQGDPGDYQEFTFASWDTQKAFVRYCEALAAREAAE